MGFGTSLLLLALAGVGIPIAAHLLRQEDLRSVSFPTVALLIRAKAQSQRRFRLRDPLLLLIRALAVATLVFAAAEPFIWKHAAFADGRLASLVLVLDDSMSMAQTANGSVSAFEEARDHAQAAVDALAQGSEVALVLAGSPARAVTSRDVGADAVREALRSASVGARGTDLAGAAPLASRLLSGAKFARRLLVLSDFAEHAQAQGIDWPRASTVFERVGASAPNRGITHAVAAPNPVTGMTSVRVRVEGSDGAARLLIANEEGETLARGETVLVDGHGEATLEVATAAEGIDHRAVVARLDGPTDALQADDHRAVLLAPARGAGVLLVDGESSGSPGLGEVSFLVRALEAGGTRGVRPLSVRTIDAGALDVAAVQAVDVVVLANLEAPTSVAARALIDFHRAGGAIVIAAGDRLQPRQWRARLDAILPAEMGPSLAKPKLLVASTSRIAAIGLGGVRAQRTVPLRPKAGTRVDMRWDDGSPALVVRDRVAIWGSTLDDDWTDLPFHPGFVALAHQLVEQLAVGAQRPSGEVGGGTRIDMPPNATVVDPAGERWAAGESFDATLAAGVYRVFEGDSEAYAFVVAAPGSETLLTPRVPEIPPASAERQDSLTHRAPIARWLYLLFGLWMIFEGILRKPRALGRARQWVMRGVGRLFR